jgi:hypothetical protein
MDAWVARANGAVDSGGSQLIKKETFMLMVYVLAVFALVFPVPVQLCGGVVMDCSAFAAPCMHGKGSFGKAKSCRGLGKIRKKMHAKTMPLTRGQGACAKSLGTVCGRRSGMDMHSTGGKPSKFHAPYVHQAAFVQTAEDTYSDRSTNTGSSADPEEVRLLGLKPLSYDEVLYGNESDARDPRMTLVRERAYISCLQYRGAQARLAKGSQDSYAQVGGQMSRSFVGGGATARSQGGQRYAAHNQSLPSKGVQNQGNQGLQRASERLLVLKTQADSAIFDLWIVQMAEKLTDIEKVAQDYQDTILQEGASYRP